MFLPWVDNVVKYFWEGGGVCHAFFLLAITTDTEGII